MEYKNHLFSLIAVFLALGIGILIGASMGENALVLNQIAVIEKLREEIISYKVEIDNHFSQVVQLQDEISCWESLEKNYLGTMLLENQLEDIFVNIVTQGALPGEIEEFLKLSGCSYAAFIFANSESWQDTIFQELLKEEFKLAPGTDTEKYLVNELSEQLLQGNLLLDTKMAEFLKANKLVRLEKKCLNISLFANESNIKKRELFIATGEIDPFLEAILNNILEKGGIIAQVLSEDEEVQKSILEAAGHDNDVYVINNFHKFYNRFEFLQFIKEVTRKG